MSSPSMLLEKAKRVEGFDLIEYDFIQMMEIATEEHNELLAYAEEAGEFGSSDWYGYVVSFIRRLIGDQLLEIKHNPLRVVHYSEQEHDELELRMEQGL